MLRKLSEFFRGREIPPVAPKASTFGQVWDEESYADCLREQLAAHEESALGKLHKAIDVLPLKVESLDVGVHLSQDEDGSFTVRVHANGPDLYVLNKAIDPWAVLFDGRAHGFQDMPANVPGFDPCDLPFDVAGTIATECVAWLRGLWERASLPGFELPVTVFVENGWTEELTAPITLQERDIGAD